MPFRPALRRLAALALLLAPLARAATQPAAAPLMPIDDVRHGQTGEVWTVFRGVQPEPFHVQVTGVLHNALGPGKSLIVCELTDERVQKMGAVAGMSGSPLYIDGKLAGVLAYQIQRFETVRYAGFTPIADMIEVSSLPEAPKDIGVPIPLPGLPRENAKTRSTAGMPDWAPLTPVFSASGLSPDVAALLEPQLAPLGISFTSLGGSRADTSTSNTGATPRDLAPGDAVAVALSVGDISLAGTGTVSHVDGKRVLAFGHPMMRLGATELPMTSAEVLTILPSQFNSIKVSNTGGIIGTFSQDRLSAIYGELGRQPPLVPVEIELPQRLGRQSLRFAIVRHEQILPAIASAGLTQAVLGSNESGLGAKGFRITTEVSFPNREPIAMDRVYAGPNGFATGLAEFNRDLTQWLFNPFERIYPDHIAFRIEETEEIPVGNLENLQVSRTEATPGETVSVTLSWRGYQRPASAETVRIPIDPAWAGRDLEIVVAPGRALDEMTGRPRLLPMSQLRSFDDYAEALRDLRETDGLYVAVVDRTSFFVDQTRATAELPGSFERIARGADESRFQRRESLETLWEQRLLPGLLFVSTVRRPLKITD
ncbi:MAG TPA: SpoIVB peptidase S55 domain-containing protein [Opitutaceae bacterium]|nr:SpoIVB peptidase S55 domain-containing protein [Opitutaceae bacterium]